MEKFWCGEHPLVVEDFEAVAGDSVIPWDALEGKSVLVTGATGFIGSLLVKALLYRADTRRTPIKVLAQIRNREKAERIFKGQLGFEGTSLIFVPFDVHNPVPDLHADFIFHTASNTASADFIEKPVDTLMTNIRGTENILEFAKNSWPASVVYLSSMEVYGQLDHEDVKESDSGYLDPLALRSSYPQGKRVAETMCSAYAAQYGVPVKIARLTLTFGAGVFGTDNRVFAQFARSAMAGKDIVLNTTGMTKRDYLYTSDAVRALLSILLLGKDGEAYNVSDSDSYITIREMAELCCGFSKSSKVVFDCSEEKAKKYAKEVHIRLDNAKLDALNKFPRMGLRASFERMMECMSAENQS